MAEREVESGPRKRFEQKTGAVFDEIIENSYLKKILVMAHWWGADCNFKEDWIVEL